jgi:hypothetical protein
MHKLVFDFRHEYGNGQSNSRRATFKLIAGNLGQQNYLVVEGVVILISAINP